MFLSAGVNVRAGALPDSRDGGMFGSRTVVLGCCAGKFSCSGRLSSCGQFSGNGCDSGTCCVLWPARPRVAVRCGDRGTLSPGPAGPAKVRSAGCALPGQLRAACQCGDRACPHREPDAAAPGQPARFSWQTTLRTQFLHGGPAQCPALACRKPPDAGCRNQRVPENRHW